MKIFVLDCSIAMSWCFTDEHTESSAAILKILHKSKAIVPSVWTLEVQNVLNVAERKKRIHKDYTGRCLELLAALPIEIDTGFNKLFNDQISEIARKHNLSAYDASYIELALRYKAPLASYDNKLRSSANEAGIKLLPNE